MKVIDISKSMMNKEFQRRVEFQLIEMKKMKMQIIQFISILKLIQMKWMNLIDNLESMMNKEFQHFMESQLIEARKMKMQMICFVLNMN
jgi:hypothetical protein